MANAFDCAKYIMKHCPSACKNEFDGNMKLQKLLFFADLIALAESGDVLFDEPILAFEKGCVVEDVRLRYRNDFHSFVKDAMSFEPRFRQEEYSALNAALDIYGDVNARDLSDASHAFDFWRENFERSKTRSGYKYKEDSEISKNDLQNGVPRMKEILSAYRRVCSERYETEKINGVSFSYKPSEVVIDDDMMDKLYRFSLKADDESYTLSYENGELVIY